MAKKAKQAAKKPLRKKNTERKRSGGSPAPGKVTVRLSQPLFEALKAERIRIKRLRPKLQPTRAGIIRDCVRKVLLEPSEARWSQPEVRETLRQEADLMEAEADVLLGSDERSAARSLYLQAASKELEALAVLEDPDEEVILSSLLRIVFLTQRGTGYKHLPFIPGG